MKYLFLILIFIFNSSCSLNKKSLVNESKSNSLEFENKLSISEKEIINEFLRIQFSKDKFKSYTSLPVNLIKEELGVMYSLNVYEDCYNERYLPIQSVTKREWILDSIQIQKLKSLLKKEKQYSWKKDDIYLENLTIIGGQDLQKSIREKTYIEQPRRLIIYISKPLIIDKNNVLISFKSGDSSLGFMTIENFTVLMKKINDKWIFDNYFYGNIYD
jgi:hypothetical protein